MTKKIFLSIVLFHILSVVLLIDIAPIKAQCSVGISASNENIVCTGDQVMLTATMDAPAPGSCTQSVNISNTTTTVTCGESLCFYDSGGPNSNYSTSESFTHTFTSNNGSPITISFLSAAGETCCDYITIYDAASATNQIHYGLLSTVNGNVSFTSTGNSLTVRFTSDVSVCSAGWEAIVSCDVCNDYTYTWSNGMTGQTITVTPTESTTYTVTAESAGCCVATASYTINPVSCVNTCCGFETTVDRAEWTLVNGTQANQWVMNTATNNGGQYSLYISNSPTATVPNHSYNASSTSAVWAYKEFEFPECEEDFILSFDWKAYGESSIDYIKVWIGDAATVSAGSTTAPAGATLINNPANNQTYFNQSSTWQHCEIILSSADYAGTVKTVYFLWRNDSSVGTMPPGAIDNVCLQACIPCNQPVVEVTPASAILCQGESVTFTAQATGGSGEGYTYTWEPAGSLDVATGETVTASPQENTVYRLRVTDSEDCAKTVRIPVEISGTRLSVSANPAGFCIGQNETVTVTAALEVEGSCNSYTYSWNTGAVGTTITVNPSISTEYTVTATPNDPACCELIASCVVAVMDCQADGCPTVTPAELGSNNPDVFLDCRTQQDVTLCANVLATAVEAEDYFVFSIPYNPPFGFTDGTRIFTEATDDVWSTSVITLPFTFCYYGNTYNQVVAGSNSIISFDPLMAGQGCRWSYDDPLPSINHYPNAIYSAYCDIYPVLADYVAATGDAAFYQGVLGEYPCRSYVFTVNNVKMFNCVEMRTFSTMTVLYEGTNIIDIYLRDVPTCATWNDGNHLVGLQNADCTMAITPPGRNTGPWTAHNEAWRFMPTGQPSYEVRWYEGTDTSATTGVVLGEGDLLTVAPTVTTDYTARLQYTACNGDYFDIINRCRVTVNSETPDLLVSSSHGTFTTSTCDTICPGQQVTIAATTEGAISYLWNTGDTVESFTLSPEERLTTYVCTTTYDNGCTNTDSVKVYAGAIIEPPTFIIESAEICEGESSTLTCDSTYSAYRWSNGRNTQSITVTPHVTTNYSLTVYDEIGCHSEADVQVIVHPRPNANFMPERYLTFLDNGEANVHFINYSTDAVTYRWDFNDPTSPNNTSVETDPDHIYYESGIYTIWLWVESDFGCQDSISQNISIQKPFYFYVPNSFTPDGDGINEEWLPIGEGVKEDDYECVVYDRFGRIVFHTTSLSQPWDGTDKGKPLPVGSYVYSIHTFTMDNVPKEYLGTVTIIR